MKRSEIMLRPGLTFVNTCVSDRDCRSRIYCSVNRGGEERGGGGGEGYKE